MVSGVRNGNALLKIDKLSLNGFGESGVSQKKKDLLQMKVGAGAGEERGEGRALKNAEHEKVILDIKDQMGGDILEKTDQPEEGKVVKSGEKKEKVGPESQIPEICHQEVETGSETQNKSEVSKCLQKVNSALDSGEREKVKLFLEKKMLNLYLTLHGFKYKQRAVNFNQKAKSVINANIGTFILFSLDGLIYIEI